MTEQRRRYAIVVDDSRAARTELRRILVALGFAVVEAEHGEEALELLRTEPGVELVLVDWHMPVMDGLTLIKTIRREPHWSELPIVMVSSEVDHRQIARALMAGADEYVMKPFDFATILGKLRSLGIVPPQPGESVE